MTNIFELPTLPPEELFETLFSNEKILIERIVSVGQTTLEREWYDQQRDEWVILLQGEAELSYLDGTRIKLNRGDYLLIPAHQKHRVEQRSIAALDSKSSDRLSILVLSLSVSG